MKNMKKFALAAAIIASLGLTTAYAATTTASEENPHKMRDLVTASQQAKSAQEENAGPDYGCVPQARKDCGRGCDGPRRINGPKGYMKNSPFNTLAKLTGKKAEDLRKDCREQKINPVQYADKLGKYNEFKAARLTMAKTRLDQGVKDGRFTETKAQEIYKRITDNMELARQGKLPVRPAHMGMHKSGPICNGPQGDVIVRCNPDGSTAQGCEGMAYREHPLYGHLPFDTLSKLTGKTAQELYAEAYKDKLTCAGLAKKLNVFAEYKAERLTAQKAVLEKAVKEGVITQEQADRRLAKVTKNIDSGQGELHGRPEPRNGMGKHNPRFSPMHPGPQVPPASMEE